MAHYKVLKSGDAGGVRHVWGMAYSAVPGTNNDAGIPWSQVVVEYATFRNLRRGINGTAARIPVAPAIQAQLDAGTLFEWGLWHVEFPTSFTGPQAIAEVRAGVNAQEAAEIARLADELRYWGHEGESI